MNRHSVGWYVTFAVLALAVFVVVYAFTGDNAVVAAARFLWNAVVFLANRAIRLFGGLLVVLARGVGLRRLSRLGSLLTGVGLAYAGNVILSDEQLKRARGWRGKLKVFVTLASRRWRALHLVWKLAIVALLVASQLYLHFLLIVFPIAFLVPVVRRLWIQIADLVFGSWYWRTFGRLHRAAVSALEAMPGPRHAIGLVRQWRIRYLCAWRQWKYDPAYRDPHSGKRWISVIEPMRLWWHGKLDRYIGRPLLAGRKYDRSSVSASLVPPALGQATSSPTAPKP
jgi:hypothetical protein